MKQRNWNHTATNFFNAIGVSEEEWDAETTRFIGRMDDIRKEHPDFGRSLIIQVLAEEFDPVVALAMYEDVVEMNMKREMFGELMSGLRSACKEP